MSNGLKGYFVILEAGLYEGTDQKQLKTSSLG